MALRDVGDCLHGVLRSGAGALFCAALLWGWATAPTEYRVLPAPRAGEARVEHPTVDEGDVAVVMALLTVEAKAKAEAMEVGPDQTRALAEADATEAGNPARTKATTMVEAMVKAKAASDARAERNDGLDPQLLVVPPGTRLDRGLVSVDAFRLAGWRSDCETKELSVPVAKGALSAAIVTDWSDGPAAQILRVSGTEPFASSDALSKAWSEWWDHEGAWATRDCLGPDAKEAVRRTLLSQRPRRSAEALEAQFGFHPRKVIAETVESRRAVVLRPGTKVCATDVAPTGGNTAFRASGGDICTSMVDGPRGGALFDAAAGRIVGITSPGDWEPGKLHSVTSWSEVPRDDQPRPAETT